MVARELHMVVMEMFLHKTIGNTGRLYRNKMYNVSTFRQVIIATLTPQMGQHLTTPSNECSHNY